MVFHWSLSDRKSLQVYRTLRKILTDLNNAVVSSHLLISKTFSSGMSPLPTVSRAPITICSWVTFMFQGFFNCLQNSRYLYYFSISFSFNLWSAGTSKSTIQQVLFFLLIINRSDRMAEITWFVCVSKSQRSLCI